MAELEHKVMKAVYCYFFPEVASLLHEVELALPDNMWNVTTPASKVRESLESLFSPPLDIPQTEDGCVDIDRIHEPIIKRIVGAYSEVVPNLGDFLYAYPTSGSSEGIFHLLANLKINRVDSIYVLSGEYEGFGAQAKNLGMGVNEIDLRKTRVGELEPGVWFISNPSARDGNIIPNETIKEVCDSAHKVILDLAYVGATGPYKFDTDHENIAAVVMSFSKPYGTFRHRIGGFAFSREPINTLYGNRWFKDTLRLLQALKIAEEIGPTKLYLKYKEVQHEILDELNRQFGLGIRPSDSFLLCHLRDEDVLSLSDSQLSLIAPYKRGDGYRFCLTPSFERKAQVKK